MIGTLRTIETRLASLSLVKPGFLEQRFHSGVRIDLPGFLENRVARMELTKHGPCVMLTVFPKDMDFDVSVTSVDHFSSERTSETIKALAVVVQDNMTEIVSKLYFAHFPQVFSTKVTDDESEARAWLEERLLS